MAETLSLPGFVNADADISRVLLPAGDARALERQWVDAEFIRDSVELSITRMLLAGVTCFADATLFPEIAAEAASLAAIRACIGLPVRGETNAWAESSVISACRRRVRHKLKSINTQPRRPNSKGH